LSLTPNTKHRRVVLDGADMMTFFAPLRCALAAVSLVRKSPVDSITTSAPTSPT